VLRARDAGLLSDAQVDASLSVVQANRDGHGTLVADDVDVGSLLAGTSAS